MYTLNKPYVRAPYQLNTHYINTAYNLIHATSTLYIPFMTHQKQLLLLSQLISPWELCHFCRPPETKVYNCIVSDE